MAYVIERASRSGTRYVGIYLAANGKYKSAGTYDSHERAYEVAEEEERHARGFLAETSPAGKATMTISEFCEQRFLRYHAVSPGTRQEYGYLAKNHIVPYVGHLRISEVNRETFFNLLVNVLPAEEASQITIARRAKSSRPCARWHSMRGTGTTTPYEASGSSKRRPNRCSWPAMINGGASRRP